MNVVMLLLPLSGDVGDKLADYAGGAPPADLAIHIVTINDSIIKIHTHINYISRSNITPASSAWPTHTGPTSATST